MSEMRANRMDGREERGERGSRGVVEEAGGAGTQRRRKQIEISIELQNAQNFLCPLTHTHTHTLERTRTHTFAHTVKLAQK